MKAAAACRVRVEVEGNKNAALPLLAACLLTTEECVLTNVPRIADVEAMARLLVNLGATVEGLGTTTLRVRCETIVSDEPDAALVGRIRGSVLLLGPLLARRGTRPPGAARRRFSGAAIDCHAPRRARVHGRADTAGPGPPARGARRPQAARRSTSYEASVTGTETALLAAAAAPGTSEIRHAACEPHVVELCQFLRKLGAGITGEGTSTHPRRGRARKLGGAQHQLWGDYIEAGSWAVVAAITGGEIDVRGARADRSGGRSAPSCAG